jgi:MFS family permease
MGRYNITVIVAGLTSVICLGLWIPGTSQGAIIAFAVLYGFSSGSFISLAPTLIAQISDLRQIGVRQGTCFTIQSFAALTGSPIAGAIVSAQSGAFTGLQIFCGCSPVASMIAYSIARVVQAGFKPAKV